MARANIRRRGIGWGAVVAAALLAAAMAGCRAPQPRGLAATDDPYALPGEFEPRPLTFNPYARRESDGAFLAALFQIAGAAIKACAER